MRKVITLLLAVLIVFAFCGCKENTVREVKYVRLIHSKDIVYGGGVTSEYLFEFTADKDYGEIEYAYTEQNNTTGVWTNYRSYDFRKSGTFYDFSYGTITQSTSLNRLYAGDKVRIIIGCSGGLDEMRISRLVIRSVDNPENSYTYTFE